MPRRRKTTEEFISDAKGVHGDRYDYSQVDYVGVHTKVTIICPNHGPFEQSPNSHLSGCGCPSCAGNIKFTTEVFIQKSLGVHGNRYDYSQVEYVNGGTKVTIICPDHGAFKQAPANHLRGSGCSFCCSNSKSTTDEFIQKSLGVHGDKYDYSSVDYMTAHNKVTIICPDHGPFEQKPNDHLSGHGCPSCRSSKGETIIADFLNTYDIPFHREHRFANCIDKIPLPFDFYLPNHNTCIEFDGIQHFEAKEYFGGQEAFEDRQKKDGIKTNYCLDNNIKLVRIPYTEENFTSVLESVLDVSGNTHSEVLESPPDHSYSSCSASAFKAA